MMGKKGFVRGMSSIKIDGSMKMVISVSRDVRPGTVEIPSLIAKSIRVPNMKNGTVMYEGIEDGGSALLVRQPCLWSGGIQPVVVRVTDPIVCKSDNRIWDSNWTIRIPIRINRS